MVKINCSEDKIVQKAVEARTKQRRLVKGGRAAHNGCFVKRILRCSVGDTFIQRRSVAGVRKSGSVGVRRCYCTDGVVRWRGALRLSTWALACGLDWRCGDIEVVRWSSAHHGVKAFVIAFFCRWTCWMRATV